MLQLGKKECFKILQQKTFQFAFTIKAIRPYQNHLSGQAKTSVKAECNVARSVQRQGERSEMKHLLLCAVPEGY